MIREGATQSALISYRSYQSKKEELNSYYKTQISTSTIYYTEMTAFWKYYKELVKKQNQEIEKQGIKPSGHYAFDEQYIFVSKQLYLRMTIIDNKTKLIIAEKLVNEEEYNDQTIKDFLENNINTETLKSITTDGRKNYKTIISAIGAIHHRCFFHLMQNLMTPLQKHVNKLERKIKTNTKKITKNKEEIERRKQKYTPHKGRIPLKDTKRQKNKNKIKTLTEENKKNKTRKPQHQKRTTNNTNK